MRLLHGCVALLTAINGGFRLAQASGANKTIVCGNGLGPGMAARGIVLDVDCKTVGELF